MSEDEPLEISISKKGRKPAKTAVKEKHKEVDNEAPKGKKQGKGKSKEIAKAPPKDDEIEAPNISMEPASPRKAPPKGVKQQMKGRPPPPVNDDVTNQGTDNKDDNGGARSDQVHLAHEFTMMIDDHQDGGARSD